MIEQAQAEHIKPLIPFIWQIMVAMHHPAVGTTDEARLQSAFQEAMLDPSFRYSYRQALIYQHQSSQEILGVLFHYPGSMQAQIDQAMAPLYQPYGLIAYAPLFSTNECEPEDWYLDTLVVHPKARGQGIGTKLIQRGLLAAHQAGYPSAALNCDCHNSRAKSLYLRLGFQVVGRKILTGHPYDYMRQSFLKN